MNNEFEMLRRINRKLDVILEMQGLTLDEIDLILSDDSAQVRGLIDKLKASSDALKAATAANQPK